MRTACSLVAFLTFICASAQNLRLDASFSEEVRDASFSVGPILGLPLEVYGGFDRWSALDGLETSDEYEVFFGACRYQVSYGSDSTRFRFKGAIGFGPVGIKKETESLLTHETSYSDKVSSAMSLGLELEWKRFFFESESMSLPSPSSEDEMLLLNLLRLGYRLAPFLEGAVYSHTHLNSYGLELGFRLDHEDYADHEANLFLFPGIVYTLEGFGGGSVRLLMTIGK